MLTLIAIFWSTLLRNSILITWDLYSREHTLSVMLKIMKHMCDKVVKNEVSSILISLPLFVQQCVKHKWSLV